MREYSIEDVLQMLRVRVGQSVGGARGLAKRWHISGPFLSMVLSGNRKPGRKILKELGLTKKKTVVTTYLVEDQNGQKSDQPDH